MKKRFDITNAAHVRQILAIADRLDTDLRKMGLMRNAEFPKFREAVLDYVYYGVPRDNESFEKKAIAAIRKYDRTGEALGSSLSALREYYAIPNRIKNTKFASALKNGKIAAPLNEPPTVSGDGSDPEPFQNWIKENYGYDVSHIASISKLSKIATRLELGLKPQ